MTKRGQDAPIKPTLVVRLSWIVSGVIAWAVLYCIVRLVENS